MEAWLRDNNAHTVEERFGAEVILEQIHRAFFSKQGWQWTATWEEDRQRKKARRLNPAYQPQIPYGILRERIASIADEITTLHVDSSEDRLVRDVSFLQFLPNLKSLHLTGGALHSLAPLRELPRLETLMINDYELEDFRPVSACQKLKSIYLCTYMSWPELPDFTELMELAHFNWRGNILLIEQVSCFPALVNAEFHNGFGAGTPLRDFCKLPEMPSLRCLKLEGVARLDGIERFSTLLNLEMRGRFRDLTPLRGLPRLTHLTLNRGDVLHSDLTLDVSPLAGMPELRELEVVTDQPVDFSSLAEAPKLREISRQGWHVKDKNLNAMEVNTMNAVLTPWDDEFALAQPRPLPPLVFRAVEDPQKMFADKERSTALQAEQKQNPRLCASEGRWFARKLGSALKKLLGEKGGSVRESIDPTITIRTLDAAERMPDIVQVIREALAWSCRARHAMVVVDLDAEWETQGDEWDPEADFKREYEDYLHQKKEIAERKAYLERLDQVRLRQQSGATVNPADFAPEDVPPAKEESEDTSAEEVEDSDVIDYQEQQKGHPMAEVLWSQLWVFEKGAFVSQQDQAAMEHLMARKAEA